MSGRAGAAGFTMVEMMVAVGIVAILAGVAMPRLGELMATRKVQGAAQSLAAAYRGAQTEAIRRNRTVEVLFTTSEPIAANTVSATPTTASAARHWLARAINPAGTGDFVGGMSLTGDLSSVTLTHATLRSVGFTASGRAIDLSGGPAAPVALAAPLVVQVGSTGTTRRLCVAVNTGGSVRVCDPSRPSGSPTACQPALPPGAC